MSETKAPDPTGKSPDRRKLIAVLYADMIGYSRLIGLDDVGTLERLRVLRKDLIDPAIEEHGGRIVNTGGDSLLMVFDSIDGAVRCAVKVQREIPNLDGDQPANRAIRFRVGINIGDVIPDGTDVHGDVVNVAARLQAECPPGGICVSRQVRDHVRDRLDLAFDELGPLNLKNIARPVEAFVLNVDSAAASKSLERSLVYETRETLPLPDKPSIAVLPFANQIGDSEQEYLSDGIASDIITELSRSRSLFVIARNSSFSYRGRATDVRQVARELGVRYVLEGSVRRSVERVRITAQLIDAETGHHIWAERYDRDVADVFEVQDEITKAVVVAIEPEVAKMERQRATRRPPGSLSAWEAYQRGLWHMAHIGVEENEAAERFLRRAIELEPSFVLPHCFLVTVISYSFSVYRRRTLQEASNEADPIARRAVFLDPSDALAHISMSDCHLLRGDHAGAVAEARQALTISPNLADCYSVLGVTLLYSGHPSEGLGAIREGMRLDPHDPMRYMRLLYVAIAHYLLGEYDASVDAANAAIRFYPNHPLVSRLLAAALGQAGRIDEARSALEYALTGDPNVVAMLRSYKMYVSHYAPWL